MKDRYDEILTDDALAFLADLHVTFDARRRELLSLREQRYAELAAGGTLDFLAETKDVREDDSWRVAEHAPGLVDRRVEITGPTDRKMTINALNSGARVWLADLEDANTPLWENMVEGQLNLRDAIDRSIDFTSPEGKTYALADDVATIVVRPRGWHLPEKHLLVDGERDVRIAHRLRPLLLPLRAEADRRRASARTSTCPRWRATSRPGSGTTSSSTPRTRSGSRRARSARPCSSRPYPAAFEMEEILLRAARALGRSQRRTVGLHVLRHQEVPDPGRGLHAARPQLGDDDRAVHARLHRAAGPHLPQARRARHRRDGGLHPEQGRGDQRRARSRRSATTRPGRPATGSTARGSPTPAWSPCAPRCSTPCSATGPTRSTSTREDVSVSADQLLDVASTPGSVTEAGLRGNISVGIRYLESWLRGSGAVGINNMMEDAATAEISRSQVWQWLHNDAHPRQRPDRDPRPGRAAHRGGDVRDPRPGRRRVRAPAAGTTRARCSPRWRWPRTSRTSSPSRRTSGCRDVTRRRGARPGCASSWAMTPSSPTDARLRTYECDGLAQYQVTPALVVLPRSTRRRSPTSCAPASRTTSRSSPAAPAPACPAARSRTPTGCSS